MSKPQVNLNVDGIMLVGLLVGVPLLGFIGWKLWGARDAIASAVDKVNPASSNNFVNQGFESVGQAITGDDSWTLGGWVYDWTHNVDGSFRKESAFDITPLGNLNKINPANPDNVINGGFNRVTQWLTGDENFSLGGWVYDATHDDQFTGAKAPINAVNPASDQNVIYKGVNGVGSYMTGDKDFTLGGWLYGVFNNE